VSTEKKTPLVDQLMAAFRANAELAEMLDLDAVALEAERDEARAKVKALAEALREIRDMTVAPWDRHDTPDMLMRNIATLALAGLDEE